MWSQSYWTPEFQACAQEKPIPIKNLRKVLIDVTVGYHPPQAELLELQAWKIGGGSNQVVDGHHKEKVGLRSSLEATCFKHLLAHS